MSWPTTKCLDGPGAAPVASRLMNRHWPLIVQLADAERIRPSTVAQWRVRGHVPHKWRLAFMTRAKTLGRRLPPEAFVREGP